MMRTHRSAALLLCTTLLWLACDRVPASRGEAEPAGVAPLQFAADSGLSAFLHGGMVEIGMTRADIAARLGEPDSTVAHTTANRHDSTVTDSVFTLFYDGLTAEVYRAGYDGKEMLTALEIRDARYVEPSSPVRPGTAAAAVRTAFGEATDTTGGALHYVCEECLVSGHETVRFVLDAGVVRSIHVQYWID